MDISQIIFIVLLVLLVGGGAFYLMQQRSQLPAVNIQSAATGNQSIFRMATGSSARIPACLLHDERAGERGPDKTLDGP
jgi:hypothetical protein